MECLWAAAMTREVSVSEDRARVSLREGCDTPIVQFYS